MNEIKTTTDSMYGVFRNLGKNLKGSGTQVVVQFPLIEGHDFGRYRRN
jgi:hypothetical protein